MSRIQLLDWQQAAADRLVEGALSYFERGQDRIGGRAVPYVAQLKAVTGAGKTPILAAVSSRLNPGIILWTTRFGGVVDQTASNLGSGGKYNHLLGPNMKVIRFSEIPSATEWESILEARAGLTVLVSTVAAWNSSERDERLNVHRVHPDWGDKSRWDQLRETRKRRVLPASVHDLRFGTG